MTLVCEAPLTAHAKNLSTLEFTECGLSQGNGAVSFQNCGSQPGMVLLGEGSSVQSQPRLHLTLAKREQSN